MVEDALPEPVELAPVEDESPLEPDEPEVEPGDAVVEPEPEVLDSDEVAVTPPAAEPVGLAYDGLTGFLFPQPTSGVANRASARPTTETLTIQHLPQCRGCPCRAQLLRTRDVRNRSEQSCCQQVDSSVDVQSQTADCQTLRAFVRPSRFTVCAVLAHAQRFKLQRLLSVAESR